MEMQIKLELKENNFIANINKLDATIHPFFLASFFVKYRTVISYKMLEGKKVTHSHTQKGNERGFANVYAMYLVTSNTTLQRGVYLRKFCTLQFIFKTFAIKVNVLYNYVRRQRFRLDEISDETSIDICSFTNPRAAWVMLQNCTNFRIVYQINSCY